MMKKGMTEIIFILDRSGSMGGLEKDTIGGYNQLLSEQKKVDGEVIVSTVLFDHESEVIHNRLSIQEIEPLTEKEYFIRGSTALLDAIGNAIDHIQYVQRKDSWNTPEKTMVIITTDGMENSSREYTYDRIKRLIKTKKERDSWEFLFLGANIDAVDVASRVGISRNRATNFHADSQGIQKNYETVSEAIKMVRNNARINDDWDSKIKSDYEKRKKSQ